MSLPKPTPTYHRDTYPSISPTKPSLTQAGKNILITGGGGGLGFEIARSFAKASAARIIIIGRRAGLLDEALMKLREEFGSLTTEFIAHQADIASDDAVTSLWEFLHSQNILVHVLILNAAQNYPLELDALSMEKSGFMEAFNTNVGGNFFMSAHFVKQTLRPTGLRLHLINVSTAGIHMAAPGTQIPYSSSKLAFTAVLGHIAVERPVEDVQIVSYHPGIVYSETVAKLFEKDAFKWDAFALPADFAVWAASPEASWLHGRFVWAQWDVDELKAEVLGQLEVDNGFLKAGVLGLNYPTFQDILNG